MAKRLAQETAMPLWRFVLIADSAVLLWTALFSLLLFAVPARWLAAMLWIYRDNMLHVMYPPLLLLLVHLIWLHRRARLNIAQGALAILNAAAVYAAGYLIFFLIAGFCDMGYLCPPAGNAP